MYIVGRVISLFIFSAILILTCFGIANGSENTGKKLLSLYIIILGIMGYCFIPHDGADLSRLLITMNYYASKSISDLPSVIFASTTPGTGLYFYIVGSMGNDHMLPAISAIITYSFCFSILKKEYNIKDTQGIYIATALFAFMARGMTMQIISNIRSIMALSICAYSVYIEFYLKEKKSKLFILYLLAASIHLMGQLMLLYRVLFLIIDKGKSPAQTIFRAAAAASLSFVVWIFGNRYIVDLFSKADSYVSYAQEGTGYSYFWEEILSIMALLLAIYMIVAFRKYNRLSVSTDFGEEATISLVRYMVPLIIADILILPIEFNFFQRLSWLITILTMPVGVSVLRLSGKFGTDKTIINNVFIYSVIMLALACVRGDLCSLKFFQL